MALLWIDSMSELANLTRTYPAGSWTGLTIGGSSQDGRDGSLNGSFAPGVSGSMTLKPPTTAAQIIVGLALRRSVINTSNIFMALQGDNSSTTHLGLLEDASGHLVLKLGFSTVLATSTNIWSDLTGYHYLEVKATCADSGGRCTVKVDGTVWIDFTGDTRNGGTATVFDTVMWAIGVANAFRLDDLYVLDGTGPAPYNDFLGDCKVARLYPNGDTGTVAWTPSSGTSHSALVKENPANTTDYNLSSTTGQRDLYTLDDMPVPTATIHGVQTFATVTKSDAGARSVSVLTKGTALASNGPYALTTSWVHQAGPLAQTDPDGNPWTVAGVNALQAGVEAA